MESNFICKFFVLKYIKHRTGRIGLHENDDPKAVALNFSRAFQLNMEMRQSLEELLNSQLETYLNSQKEENNIESKEDK